MKKVVLIIVGFLSMVFSITSYAAVTKVVISTTEPVVGEKPDYYASVPETASTEVVTVEWDGEFKKGVFVQGNDYTMIVKLRIKDSSSNVFSLSSNINVTINGHKARVTSKEEKNITVKYTWKTLGGEHPDSPEYKLKAKLTELSSTYNATNATNDKEVLQYLRSKISGAEIWAAGGTYKFTRRLPSETEDGSFSMDIGIKQGSTTIDRFNFRVILPARNKSAYSQLLNEDMSLMKTALQNLIVTSKTTGKDIIAAVNAAAIHGTKAEWDENYTYKQPTSDMRGSIDGNLILALGDKKESFKAHKTLPVRGNAADAAIDADFSRLSHALHNYPVTNKTTQNELLKIAYKSIEDGSTLTCTDFVKTNATYEDEGKIVMYFELTNKDKVRSPRIAIKIAAIKAVLPPELAVTQDEWQVLRLTNIKRFNEKLPLLVMASPLQDGAHIRAKEVYSNYKLGHIRPDGSPFTFALDQVFISHRSISENILSGPDRPSKAIENWMTLPRYKGNILNENYCYIGNGVFTTSTGKTWVQIFVGECTVLGVESSTGSFYFDTVEEMENAYLICNMGYHSKGYIPIDVRYMVKEGNKYTLRLKGKTVTLSVYE